MSHTKGKEFDLSFPLHSSLPEYNALTDLNMRRYFENSNLQKHLWRTGQIDSNGRLINLEKNKSKIQIIDKEFVHAKEIEMKLKNDEHELRKSVRTKCLQEIEQKRKLMKCKQCKENQKMKKDVKKVIHDILSSGAVQN